MSIPNNKQTPAKKTPVKKTPAKKTPAKRTSKNKENQKTVQQLRGFWTAFAKKQKEKSKQEEQCKTTHKKTSDTVLNKSATDFVFEGSPKPTPISEGSSSVILESSIYENPECTQVHPIIAKIEKGNLDLELPKLD